MMTQDHDRLWTYIPVTDFDVPTPPVSDAARGGVLHLWRSLQGFFRHKKSATEEEPQWDRPTEELLRSVSPDPNWSEAAVSFAAGLRDDWLLAEQCDRPLRALVGPPGCDVASVVRSVAEQYRLKVLAAPSPETLLGSSEMDRSAWPSADEPDGIVVIPHLEHWFFRHEEGLTLVRNLIERLHLSRSRALIACDSWAWAFFGHALSIADTINDPLTVAAFDASKLDTWFRSNLNDQDHGFRQRADDEPVFPENLNTDGDGKEPTTRHTSTVIKSLAATSRGSLGVASAFWCASLRTHDSVNPASERPARGAPTMLEVASPYDLRPPALPDNVARVNQFILHSLLLHGGLPLSSLIILLPFSRDEIQSRVAALLRVGILEVRQGRLNVTLTVYPSVRQSLLNEGFLTDAF